MSQNPYESPQFDSVDPAAESEPETPILSGTTRLEAHAFALGYGGAAYFAVLIWVTIAIGTLGLGDWWSSYETRIQVQLLAPILPAFLFWAIVLRDGLTSRNSVAVRRLTWIVFVALLAGMLAGAFLALSA